MLGHGKVTLVCECPDLFLEEGLLLAGEARLEGLHVGRTQRVQLLYTIECITECITECIAKFSIAYK